MIQIWHVVSVLGFLSVSTAGQFAVPGIFGSLGDKKAWPTASHIATSSILVLLGLFGVMGSLSMGYHKDTSGIVLIDISQSAYHKEQNPEDSLMSYQYTLWCSIYDGIFSDRIFPYSGECFAKLHLRDYRRRRLLRYGSSYQEGIWVDAHNNAARDTHGTLHSFSNRSKCLLQSRSFRNIRCSRFGTSYGWEPFFIWVSCFYVL